MPCIKKLVTNVVANSRVVMVDERSGDDVEEGGYVQYQHLINITSYARTTIFNNAYFPCK